MRMRNLRIVTRHTVGQAYLHPSSEIDDYLAFSDFLAMPFPVHNNTISISIPFPKDSEVDLDYTTAVSDQTLGPDNRLLRAFDGTARNQTSISTLRVKFDPKTQRCVSKNDPELIYQMSECSRVESNRGQNVKWSFCLFLFHLHQIASICSC